MPVNTRLNSKTRLVLVEKKRAKISEMLSTSVQCFLKYRLGFCCNWSFSRYLHRLLFHNVYQVLIKLYLIIHVNFFNFRKSLKKLLSRSLVVAEKELLTQPWRSKFQKGFFEKITISLKEVVLIEVHLLRDDSKPKKKKNKHKEYHNIFKPFKSQVYSKHESLIFLLFGSWSLVLYLHIWVQAKFFWKL